MSNSVESREEFDRRIVRYLIELRSVRSFVGRIARCLIEFKAVMSLLGNCKVSE